MSKLFVEPINKKDVKNVTQFARIVESQEKAAEQLLSALNDDDFTDKKKWNETFKNFKRNEKKKLELYEKFLKNFSSDKLYLPSEKRQFDNLDVKIYRPEGYQPSAYDTVKKDKDAIVFLQGDKQYISKAEQKAQEKEVEAMSSEDKKPTETEEEKEEEKPTETEATETVDTSADVKKSLASAIWGLGLEKYIGKIDATPDDTFSEYTITDDMRYNANYMNMIAGKLVQFYQVEYPSATAQQMKDIGIENFEFKNPLHAELQTRFIKDLDVYFNNQDVEQLTPPQLEALSVSLDPQTDPTDEEEKEEIREEEEEALREGEREYTSEEREAAKEAAAAFIQAGAENESAEREAMGAEDMPPLPPPPVVPAVTQPKTGAPEIINRDLSRTQPGMQSGMQQAQAAMGGSVQATDAEQQRVATMTIKEVKARIKALHDAYDGLIPSLTTDQHKKNKERAMKTKNADEAKGHLLDMLKLIREYFAGPLGGLTVGVVIPAQDYLQALMGTMGKDGDCGCKHDEEEHKHTDALDDPMGTIYDPPGTRQPEDNTAPGKPHPGDVLKDRHGHDSFGRAFMVSNHYRNSGIDRTKGVAGYEARTVFDQPKQMRPPAPPPTFPNMSRDQIRFYANRRPRGMVPGLKIPT